MDRWSASTNKSYVEWNSYELGAASWSLLCRGILGNDAAKCLTTGWGQDDLICNIYYFYGVITGTMEDFKLPRWCLFTEPGIEIDLLEGVLKRFLQNHQKYISLWYINMIQTSILRSWSSFWNQLKHFTLSFSWCVAVWNVDWWLTALMS